MATPTYTQTTSPLHLLPAEHPAWGVIRQCMEISSGTLAVLIDSGSYDEVYAVRANWLDYLAEHADLAAQMECWTECWWMFWDTSHAAEAGKKSASILPASYAASLSPSEGTQLTPRVLPHSGDIVPADVSLL